jgi:dolichyl-phosphate beta-glucosyltransferase
MTKGVYLSVVIPSFEEMANLQKGVLEKVKLYLDKQKYSYEVIVVDDGSKDGSVEFIDHFVKENHHFSLIKNPHLGKAGAVTTGMLKAHGKYVLFTDMDQATPIEEIEKILPFFSKGYDVVIGSRSTRRKGAPFIRRFVSVSAIVLRKFIIGMDSITDTQCGFKAFTNETAQTLFSKIKELRNGFDTKSGSAVTPGFDVELLYLALKHGYKVKEVPVSWLYVETRRVSPLKDSFEGVMDLIRIKMNDQSGKYSL